MAWYLQFNHYPLGEDGPLPDRKDFKLDCPNKISCHQQALAKAKKILEQPVPRFLADRLYLGY